MGGAKRYPSTPVRVAMGIASLHPSYEWHTFAISRRNSPEVCWRTSRPLCRRAQGRPGACCTRGPACDLRKTKLHTSIQGSGNTPAFPAQWLYGLLRALPGERLFCLRRPRKAFASLGLNASTAASEPHDFTVRVRRVRLARPPRPSHLTARP